MLSSNCSSVFSTFATGASSLIISAIFSLSSVISIFCTTIISSVASIFVMLTVSVVVSDSGSDFVSSVILPPRTDNIGMIFSFISISGSDASDSCSCASSVDSGISGSDSVSVSIVFSTIVISVSSIKSVVVSGMFSGVISVSLAIMILSAGVSGSICAVHTTSSIESVCFSVSIALSASTGTPNKIVSLSKPNALRTSSNAARISAISKISLPEI